MAFNRVLCLVAAAVGVVACTSTEKVTLFPANGAKGVHVDTHLTLTFAEEPTVGASGWIRIRDVQSGACVDSLDLSVPAGPTESRTYAPDIDYTKVPYDYSRSFVPTNRNTVPGTPSGTAEPTPPESAQQCAGVWAYLSGRDRRGNLPGEAEEMDLHH